VFSLPSGALCLVTGDVVGYGLAAAQSMNQIRTALRSYALENEDPARLLAMLDQYVQRFQVAAMSSVICAILRPSRDLLEVSSAGHLPPVLAEPDSEARIVQVPPDLPLGIDAYRPRRVTPVVVAPGGVLCLYTDGLVERRGIPIDTNLERLRASVFPQSAESVCISVMANLIGRDTPRDDVALLVLRNLADSSE
jgi:serine phosphatase RsbU (regulator of sigma subunit)